MDVDSGLLGGLDGLVSALEEYSSQEGHSTNSVIGSRFPPSLLLSTTYWTREMRGSCRNSCRAGMMMMRSTEGVRRRVWGWLCLCVQGCGGGRGRYFVVLLQMKHSWYYEMTKLIFLASVALSPCFPVQKYLTSKLGDRELLSKICFSLSEPIKISSIGFDSQNCEPFPPSLYSTF